jgi:hypothetical protein
VAALKINRRRLPSIGFLAVGATYIFAVAFFVWGFKTPDLERIWFLHHELKIGRVYEIKKQDRKTMLRAMARYKNLARALLPSGEIGIISENSDGWIATPIVTILRTPESRPTKRLRFDIRTSKALLPYAIGIQGSNFKRKLKVKNQGYLNFRLPDVPQKPEIITVRLEERDFLADPSVLGIRIQFLNGE